MWLRRIMLRLVGLPPLPSLSTLGARHTEWSLVSSADDLQPQPSEALLDLLFEGAKAARQVSLNDLAVRATSEQATYFGQWPGEHYRLLAGLVNVMQPRRIVEIGTATGMSALALLSTAPPDAQLITYDLIDWRSFPDTVLREEDFGNRLSQRLLDISDTKVFHDQQSSLSAAELIFIDGPKDGQFEPRITDLLVKNLNGRSILLIYDDIRLVNMLRFWRELPLPKLDATSLGHWSGTGLAMLTPP